MRTSGPASEGLPTCRGKHMRLAVESRASRACAHAFSGSDAPLPLILSAVTAALAPVAGMLSEGAPTLVR
jgi:hypothetical protein